MSKIAENLKQLRKEKNLTQGELAEKLDVTRSVIGAYEEGRAEPRLPTLVKMAEFFGISVDELIGAAGKGEGMKILSITVDSQDRENIELVPQKAAAGYLNGYSDPEFLEELPRFQLPMLSQGTFRAFEISGDSMLPLRPGTVVIGEYIESAADLKNNEPAIFVTSTEGVVFKRPEWNSSRDSIILKSDNPEYSPYRVSLSDVMEIWRARAFISMDFPDPETENADTSSSLTVEELSKMVLEMKKEIQQIKK